MQILLVLFVAKWKERIGLVIAVFVNAIILFTYSFEIRFYREVMKPSVFLSK